jgi:hypothetical protein
MEPATVSIATVDLVGLGEPAVDRCGPRGEQDGARGLRAVAHLHRHRGRDVVVYRAYRGIDQGVDELALALLELSHDEDADRGIRESPGRMPQPRHEVSTPLLLAQGPRALYQVRCCLAHVSLLDGCQPLQHRESIVGPSRRADSEITAPRTTPARSGRTHEPGGDAPPGSWCASVARGQTEVMTVWGLMDQPASTSSASRPTATSLLSTLTGSVWKEWSASLPELLIESLTELSSCREVPLPVVHRVVSVARVDRDVVVVERVVDLVRIVSRVVVERVLDVHVDVDVRVRGVVRVCRVVLVEGVLDVDVGVDVGVG